MEKKESAFTLIELLVVLVILTIVAVITVPIVLQVIEKARRQAFLESARNLVEAVQLEYVDKRVEKPITHSIREGVISPNLPVSGKTAGNGYIEIDSYRNVRLTLTQENICAQKRFSDANVSLIMGKCDIEPDEMVNLDQSGASVPQLDSSMVPIRFDGNTWVKADPDNTNRAHQWYDYSKGMWANMAVIRSTKKKEYQALSMGSPIDEKDVVGYFVGIPSFVYRLPSGTSERSFDVRFTNQQVDGYYSHPAFQWGEEKITGFWAAKYELSSQAEKLAILPNQSTLKNSPLVDVYKQTEELNILKRKAEPDLKIGEIHLMKNVEWGATAVLSQSIYGVCPNYICTKVEKNETWKTGYADKNSPYNTEKGMQTSTTGNIYGIYDMNGGAWEFVMGTSDIGTLKSSIAKEKYDLYENKGIIGDLTTEDGTAGWYQSTASFLNKSQPWFIRGGDVNTADSSLFWYRGDGVSGGFRNGFRLSYVIVKQ